jgi:hypothetical protein
MKLPIRDEALDLVSLLRNLLPSTFPAPNTSLSAYQQRQLDDAKDTLLTELVLGHSSETRKAVFASDIPTIEDFLSGYNARSAMAWLGIAFLVAVIIERRCQGHLSRGSTPQTPKEEYFAYAAPRLKIEASMLSNLYKEGSTFEDKKYLLLGGTGDMPGVTLDFIARNRTKLLDLTEAIQRHNQREALQHFRDDSSREFAQWAKYTAPTSSSAADEAMPEQTEEEKAQAEARNAAAEARKVAALARAEARSKTIAERQAAINAEAAALDDEGKFVIQTIQAGMVPFPAEAPQGRPEFLNELPARLVAYRERLAQELRARTPCRAFDSNDSVNLADGLWDISSVLEAEERISSAVTSLAGRKRTVCILAYRLHNEPELIQQWRAMGYDNLQEYAKARLNIGPEIYKYAKIGRALLRYHYLIADLPDHDSEGFFRKMEHVERAILTHKGSLAVEHALIVLSPEDFKEFSRNADFKEREFPRLVTQALLDEVYVFRSSMLHMRAHGGAVRLVALVDQDEARFLHVIFDEMEAELKAQAAITLADRPAMDAAPVEKVATKEVKAPVEYAAAV